MAVALTKMPNRTIDTYFKKLLSNKKMDPFEQFSYELNRIATFGNWPSDIKVRPPHLAKAGFFYRGRSTEVMCYECKCIISEWTHTETRGIDDEHLRVSPDCSMARTHGNASTNVPLLPPTPREAASKSRSEWPSSDFILPTPLTNKLSNFTINPTEVSHKHNVDAGRSSLRVEQHHTPNHARPPEHDFTNNPKEVSATHDVDVGASSLRAEQLHALTHDFINNPEEVSAKHDVDAGRSSLRVEKHHTPNHAPEPDAIYTTSEIYTPDDHVQPLRLNGPTSTFSFGSVPSNESDLFRYKSEAARLSTFEQWPSDSPIAPSDLARSGFYSVHEGDKVRCIFCHGILVSWESGDVVHEEHQRHFPNCPFIEGLDAGNIPIVQQPVKPPSANKKPQPSLDALGVNIERPKHPKYALEIRRLESFTNWPIAKIHRPEVLAKAGFFYHGTGKDDRVRCFFCDGGLQKWLKEDDPVQQHALNFPKCVFLLQQKGEDYIKKIQSEEKHRKAATNGIHSLEEATTVQEDRETGSSANHNKLSFHGDTVTESSTSTNTKKKRRKRNKKNAKAEAGKQDVEGENNSAGEDEADPGGATVIATLQEKSIPLTEHQQQMVQTLEEENSRLQDQRTCKVCMDRQVSQVFLPCGHLVCCPECGNNVSKCPICRMVIKGTIHISL